MLLSQQLDCPRFSQALKQFSSTTEKELSGLIRKSALKSCCLDLVPAKLLGLCRDDLLPVVTRTVNLSFVSTTKLAPLEQAVCHHC